jgi:hypothetical protein
MSAAAASGIGTPSSRPADNPSCKSLRSRALVKVGWKSRFTSAGDLYLVNVEPSTESFRNSRNAARLTPPRSASTVTSASDSITTPRKTLCAIFTSRAASPSPT